MNKIITFFDISGLYYSSFYAGHNLSYRGFPTGMIYRTIQSVLKVLKDNTKTDYVLALDSPPYRRLEIDTQYKGTRTPAASEFHDQRSQLEAFFQAGTSAVASSRGYEADDMLACLVSKYKRLYDQVIIFSRDSDMLQLLDDNVRIEFLKGHRVTKDAFIAQYGIQPSDWPIIKAIVGDKADNIPNTPGVGPKTAIKYVLGTASKSAVKKIDANWVQIKKNLELIRLPFDGAVSNEHLKWNFTEDLLMQLVEQFGFKSYTKQKDRILQLLNCQ